MNELSSNVLINCAILNVYSLTKRSYIIYMWYWNLTLLLPNEKIITASTTIIIKSSFHHHSTLTQKDWLQQWVTKYYLSIESLLGRYNECISYKKNCHLLMLSNIAISLYRKLAWAIHLKWPEKPLSEP